MIKVQKFKEVYIILAIFILAFVLRMLYLSEVKTHPLFYPATTGLDDNLYHLWAEEIARGDWLGEGAFNAMPLYPYFLALVYKIFGTNILAAKIIQFILGAFSCILIYFIARKIFAPAVAIISGLLASFYGPFIFYEEILLAVSLTIFLYLISFLVLLWALDAPSAKRFFVFGLFAGLSTLSKASILLFIPIVIFLLLLKYKPGKRSLCYVACLALGLSLMLAPLTLRNYLICKDFIPLVAHGGINFYIGNNVNADGTFRTPKELGGTQQGLLINSKIFAEKITRKRLKPEEVWRFWFARGMSFIRTKPQEFIALLGRKLLLFINFYEIPDVRDYQFAQQHFGMLNILLDFNLVLIFAISGLFFSSSSTFKAMLLKLFILMYVISVLLFFVNSRYRLPLVPFLIVLAGAGIYQYIRMFKNRFYKRALVSFAPLIIVFILGNTQLVPQDFSGSYNLIGLYHLKKSAYSEAIGYFKKATQLNPQMDIAHYNMGRALMELGDSTSALDSFNQALNINPYLYAAYNDKGNIYLSMDKLDRAYAQFRQALEVNPDYAKGHANLGLVYKKKGLWDLAIKEYKRALELAPDLAAEIYNNLGLVYFSKGESPEAISYFQKSHRINPNLAYAYYNLGLVLAKEKMFAQAKKLWEQALILDPGLADAQQRLKKLKEMGY